MLKDLTSNYSPNLLYLATCLFDCIVAGILGGGESDMELDLLGDSESDSDESTHSHTDNVSIQRSAITAATAGSDAGAANSIFVLYVGC